MGGPISLLPFWAFLLLSFVTSTRGPYVGALADGTLGGPLGGPPGEAPVEIAYEAATTPEEDVSGPLHASQGHQWCRALDLHSDNGACSTISSSSGSNSVLPQSLDDGCFGLVLLLLLLAAVDQIEGMLRRVWGPLSSVVKRARCSSSSNDNSSSNRFAAAAETEEGKKLLGELVSLQQELQKQQMEQQQLSATAEFAAYARKQRKIDQLIASRDACIQQLQQLQDRQKPQQQPTKNYMLLQAATQLLLKPLAKRHGFGLAKCWGLAVTSSFRLPF
ncbi:uncharacterized protein EMH_0067770 [Eimeria mitis]|uniref:Uncharacterized protein n=1 Tax=Eimeria mitis TaxID=44415 RepID=U6KIS2_9EIME|nr:uncharacterized protein EMH_0067770 [Eimeria mitis]CDJ36177.1 hypothetical protein, conserved [Eimeria mitis]